jgi:hypothetical protein
MEAHVGMKEVPANSNRGNVIDQANTYTGVDLGSPWCASIISLAYKMSGFDQPRDARSAALFPPGKRKLKQFVKAGDLGGIYYPRLKRIGHVVMIRKFFGNFVLTIEGNTNRKGNREGDGLFYYIRPLSEFRYFSNWPAKVDNNPDDLNFLMPI